MTIPDGPLHERSTPAAPREQELPYPVEFFRECRNGCSCHACVPLDADPMSVHAQLHLCPHCGNKRCPGAVHHDRPCSGSNAKGQPGSFYEFS